MRGIVFSGNCCFRGIGTVVFEGLSFSEKKISSRGIVVRKTVV